MANWGHVANLALKKPTVTHAGVAMPTLSGARQAHHAAALAADLECVTIRKLRVDIRSVGRDDEGSLEG